jgi:hypothetical protein
LVFSDAVKESINVQNFTGVEQLHVSHASHSETLLNVSHGVCRNRFAARLVRFNQRDGVSACARIFWTVDIRRVLKMKVAQVIRRDVACES